MSTEGDVYCRNCGVRLRRVAGVWWHAQQLGPVPCPKAEPETGPQTGPETGPDRPDDGPREP